MRAEIHYREKILFFQKMRLLEIKKHARCPIRSFTPTYPVD